MHFIFDQFKLRKRGCYANINVLYLTGLASGGSKGARGTHVPPGGPNSFNSMQFLGKFGKIICWRSHLGEILDPPLLAISTLHALNAMYSQFAILEKKFNVVN